MFRLCVKALWKIIHCNCLTDMKRHPQKWRSNFREVAYIRNGMLMLMWKREQPFNFLNWSFFQIAEINVDWNNLTTLIMAETKYQLSRLCWPHYLWNTKISIFRWRKNNTSGWRYGHIGHVHLSWKSEMKNIKFFQHRKRRSRKIR